MPVLRGPGLPLSLSLSSQSVGVSVEVQEDGDFLGPPSLVSAACLTVHCTQTQSTL